MKAIPGADGTLSRSAAATADLRQRPLHHLVVWQRVGTVPGLLIPALYLAGRDTEDEVRHQSDLSDFMVAHSSRSSTWMLQRARGVGLFHDYLVQTAPGAGLLDGVAIRFEDHAGEFAALLDRGAVTFSTSGLSSTTGLLWAPGSSRQQVICILLGTQEFLHWVRDRDAPQRGGGSSASTAQWHLRSVRRNRPPETDFLAHLAHLRSMPASVAGRHAVRKAQDSSSGTIRFPTDKMDALLEHGFTIDRGGKPVREDLTAKLVACSVPSAACAAPRPCTSGRGILGGSTASRPSSCIIRRAGPPLPDREVRTAVSRSSPGRACCHGPWSPAACRPAGKACRSARTGKDRLFWRWTLPQRRLFVDAATRYLTEERPRLMQARVRRGLPEHPFLLGSSGASNHEHRGDSAGDPYTMAAMRRPWARAISRLAARTGDGTTLAKGQGTTLHGLRHR